VPFVVENIKDAENSPKNHPTIERILLELTAKIAILVSKTLSHASSIMHLLCSLFFNNE